MEVSGTAFRDVTNAAKQQRWQALQKFSEKPSVVPASAKDPTNEGAAPDRSAGLSVSRSGGSTHAAQHHATQSPALPLCKSVCSSQSSQPGQPAEVHRQARRLHRRRVARIVADQWIWFTRERTRQYPAIRHHKHRLMLTAFLALQRHAAHRQLEWRRAAIFNHRRQYLIQGKCLLLWHAQLAYSRRVQQILHKAQAARHRQLQISCLTAWKSYRVYKAERRRQHLQASFYKSFVLLSSTIHNWRSAAQASASKHARKSRALSFWAAKQYDKAFSSWITSIAAKQQSSQMKNQAISFHRQKLILAVLQHWQAAVSCILDSRQAGSEALQVNVLKSCLVLTDVCPSMNPW